MRGKVSSWSGTKGRLVADEDGGKYDFLRREVEADEYGRRNLVAGEPVEFTPNNTNGVLWATEVLADRIDLGAEPDPSWREDAEIFRFSGKVFFCKRFNGGDAIACLYSNIITDHGELKQGTRVRTGIERHPEDPLKWRGHSVEIYQD